MWAKEPKNEAITAWSHVDPHDEISNNAGNQCGRKMTEKKGRGGMARAWMFDLSFIGSARIRTWGLRRGVQVPSGLLPFSQKQFFASDHKIFVPDVPLNMFFENELFFDEQAPTSETGLVLRRSSTHYSVE